MICEFIEWLISKLPEGKAKDDLVAWHDEHCQGGVTTNSGGGGNGGKDPDQ